MADNINFDMVTAEQQINEKIKAFNTQIVVSDSPDKPYYSISYYDITKKEWYIGYSSYSLENVYKWLFECFEEVDCDMVEVVRCKDCIHWYEPEGVCLKIYSDGAVSPYAWQDRNPDDFCSYGERKDNETV